MKFFTKHKNFLLLVSIGFLMRLILANYGTYQLDHNTFIAWAHSLNEVGYQNFYSTVWSDYLPGYLHVLKLISHIEQITKIPSVILYKLPAIIGDLATASLVYTIARKYSVKISLILVAVLLFNPAVFVNSTLWGQVDIFSSFFPLASIYFIGNPVLSAILIGIGGSIKPQAAMTVPILLAIMIAEKWSIRKIFSYGIITSSVLLLIFLPFDNNGNIFQFFIDRVSATMGQYPYGSVNAFNLWGLWGFWRPDNIGFVSAKSIGSIILILISLLTFQKVRKDTSNRYEALGFLLFANFMFLTRMHERHLLPMLIPLVLLFNRNILSRFIYFVLSLTYLANIAYAYQYISPDKQFVISDMSVKVVILINLIVFVIWFREFILDKKIDFQRVFQKFNNKKNKEFNKDWLNRLQARRLLMVIMLFAFVSRVLLLWHPNEYYFDEIYHEFTARQMLVGDSRPWHWSSAHPEGFAYEWTHPPLGKEIMAVSMFILGENHFSARFPGALLGVGVIFLTYLIAKKLTKREDIAIISSAILSLDGLTFTMSRIATVDIYFLFFSLATLYFLIKEKYLLSSLMLGFALAAKWSTLWLIPILIVAFISQRLKIKKSLLFFFILPITIYVFSYLPMFLHGYDLKTFWEMQKQMWWYHSGLDATHPYTSSWWTWPFNYRPVYLYQYDKGTGLLGNIYAMGNPIFFWSGLISILFTFYALLKRLIPKVSGFILFSYLAFFVPWAISPRIMFIYHYLPSLPFLAILLAITLKTISKRFATVALLATLICFIYFYPHWTGIPIPDWFSGQYYWIKSWR